MKKYYLGIAIASSLMLTGCNSSDSDSSEPQKVLIRAQLEQWISEGNIVALESADVSDLTDMSYLFAGTDLNPDISGWDTSSVTNMEGVFKDTTRFNQDISGWDTSNVTNMASMFEYATSFNQDLSQLNTSSLQYDNNILIASGIESSDYFPTVTTESTKIQLEIMGLMVNCLRKPSTNSSGDEVIGECRAGNDETAAISAVNALIANIDISELTSLDYLFGRGKNRYANWPGVRFRPDISGWVTSNVTSMKYTFFGNPSMPDVSNWNTAKVTDITGFATITFSDYDLSGWNTSAVVKDDVAFSATNMASDQLPDTPHKVLYAAIIDNDKDTIEKADISDMSVLAFLFYNSSIADIDLSGWDTSSVTDMSGMFYGASVFNSELSEWDTSNVTDMSYMFFRATAFNGDLSGWDTSSVTNMRYMFYQATTFNGDLSGWDTSSVTDMGHMFYNTTMFNSELSEWDTSNVTDMNDMFYSATAFNSDLSGWDTSSVTDMRYMFANATAFTGDLSGWNVNAVIYSDNFSTNSSITAEPAFP